MEVILEMGAKMGMSHIADLQVAGSRALLSFTTRGYLMKHCT